MKNLPNNFKDHYQMIAEIMETDDVKCLNCGKFTYKDCHTITMNDDNSHDINCLCNCRNIINDKSMQTIIFNDNTSLSYLKDRDITAFFPTTAKSNEDLTIMNGFIPWIQFKKLMNFK